MGEGKKCFYSIEALRGFAAIIVVLVHLSGHFPLGKIGVDLFFVISGFVMVRSCTELFHTRGAATIFLTRRIMRIVPLYWLATLTVLYLSPTPVSHELAATSLFFIPAVNPNGTVLPVLGPGWTLNIEMFFYTVFACFLFLPMRFGVFAASGALCVAVGLGFTPLMPFPFNVFWSTPIIVEFIPGMMIAYLSLNKFRLTLAQSLLILTLGVIVVFAHSDLQTGVDRAVFWGLPMALVVAAFVLSKYDAPLRLRPVARFAGNVSYPLYVTHVIVIGSLATQSVGVTFAAVIAVAVLIHLAIDKPIQSALKIALSSRKPQRITG